MKKNVVFVALAASASILLASCGSTKIAIQEHSPVAVFSIVGNSQVPWVADDPNNPDEADADGVLSSVVNKLIDGQNPEIVTALDRLDYADDSIHQILPEITGCEVLEKNVVLSSEGYDELKPSYFNLLASTKTATGYKDLTTLGSKNARIAMSKIGAKSAIVLNFTFQKKLLKGNKWNGELCGLVTMKAKLLNERGKELLNKTYVAQTTERTKISSHKYDKDSFVNTLKEGIDSAIRMFALEFVDNSTVTEEVSEAKGQAIALPARSESGAEESAPATESPAEPAKAE